MEVRSLFTCNFCGGEVPPGLEYCPSCGNLYVETRPCHKCGLPVPINVRLCTQCGAFQENAVLDATASGARVGPPPGMEGAGPYPPGYGPVAGAPEVKDKALWMRGPRIDPVYIAAGLLAVLAGALYWVPTLNVILACLALVTSGFGYYRYFASAEEHAHLWLNIVASGIALVALVVSVRWTMQVEQIVMLRRFFC